jgi:thiol-disulfide isomerase/thioredoxin
MRWGRAAAWLLPLVLVGVGSAIEYRAIPSERSPLGEFIPVSPPEAAPAISLVDLAGNTVSLAEFAGKFVLVNLWATWCEPCLREMPSLERMQRRLGDEITVLAISEDRGGSKTVEPFIDKLGLKAFKTYLDPRSAAGRAFKAEGLPTSILIDREGRVIGRVEGAAEWDSPKLLGVLRSLLAGDGVIKASFRTARP